MLYLALTLLSTVMALPQPLPLPVLDSIAEPSSLTTINFAQTSRRASGTKTTKVADSGLGGNGGGVTKVINHTVTTGRYRGSGHSKPALVSGKLAGIIIGSIIALVLLLVLAGFIYKRRKAKKAIQSREETKDEEEEVGDVNEKEVEVGAAPVVVGEMAYASQPANPHSNADMMLQQPKVVDLGVEGVVAAGK